MPGKRGPKALETRYRELLYHLPVGVYRTTADGRLLECNRALADMLGYADVAEMQRMNVLDTYVRRDERALYLASTGRGQGHNEFELRRRDGSTFWVRDYGRVVTDESGELLWYEGIMVDITAERSAQEAVRRSEADYRGLFENAHDAIMILDPETMTVLTANQQACDLYGYPKSEFIGLSLARMTRELDQGKERIRQALDGNGSQSFEGLSVRKDGTEMTVDVRTAVIEHQGRRALLSINRDITERKRMEETIRALALHDPLTGLPNRKLLYDRLGVAIAAARRNRRILAFMYLDLDRFKDVNDRHGHAAGDELLVAVARRLVVTLRDSDTVARMGGDEFTILVPEVPSEESAQEIARKILSALREPLELEGSKLTVTSSIGVAIFPVDGDTPDGLMRSADAAMYRAKGAGKDRWDRAETKGTKRSG